MSRLRMCLASLLVGFLASQDIGAQEGVAGQEKERGKRPGAEKDVPARVSIGAGDIPTRDFLGVFADINGLPVLIEAADSPKLSETITVVAPIRNASDALLREILHANGWFIRRDVLPDGQAVLRVSKTGRALPDLDTSIQRIIITAAGSDKITGHGGPRILEAHRKRRPQGTRRLRVFELRHREIESFARLLISIFSPPDNSAAEKDPKIEVPTILGPVKIIADRPTRQIVVVTWHLDDLEVIEAIIQKLDRPETNPLVTRVYRVQHQKVSLLMQALRPIYGKSSTNGELRIASDERANSILLRLPRDRDAEVLRVLKILDDPRISLAGFQTPKPAKKLPPKDR